MMATLSSTIMHLECTYTNSVTYMYVQCKGAYEDGGYILGVENGCLAHWSLIDVVVFLKCIHTKVLIN